jgi:integrase
MKGAPMRVVQELLGHSTLQMTMRYAHLSPSVKTDAVAVLDAGAAPILPHFRGMAAGLAA